jgi:predicted MFS family arabinose efflux permease
MGLGEPARPAATDGSAASPAYRSYVVWLLFLIAVVNYFDRQIINILAEQIKHDLGLADWQLGLLTGLAFAALYTFFGIPVALFADRSNRARIVAGSLAAWSFFTATCGLAQNFTQLFLSRLLVGLGEAGCQPPSLSLISEYAPRETRAKAMGVYALGIPAGSLIALTVGGVLSETLGWRAAFLIAGAPGLLLALVAFLTLRDPRSRRAAGPAPARSVRSSFLALRSNRVFWWLSLGSASMALVSYGQLAFFGSFFLRVHKPGLAGLSADLHQATGLTLGPLGLVGVGLGVVIGLAGLIGAFLGGQLGQWFSAKTPSALMWVPAIAAPLCVPFYLAAFMAPSAPLAFLLLFVPKLIGSVWLAPTFAALQGVVPPDVRATASAVQSSVVLLIGLGLGPVAVGAASDALSSTGLGEAEGVRWALMGTSSICIVAALFFTAAARAMKATRLS